MSTSSHRGESEGLTQNQNNSMSDDPGDGGRRAFKPTGEGQGPEGAPDDQGPDRLEELGRRGAKQD